MKLLDILAGYLGPWVWAAVLGALVASHGAVAWWVHAEATERHKLDKANAAAAHEKALRIEQAKQHELERSYQTALNQAVEALTYARKTIAEQAARISSLRLDAGGLRDQLAAFAAGRTGADSAATGEDRAQALAAYAADLGAAAAAVGRTAAVAARERDEYAAELVACVAGWPKAPSVTGPSDEAE